MIIKCPHDLMVNNTIYEMQKNYSLKMLDKDLTEPYVFFINVSYFLTMVIIVILFDFINAKSTILDVMLQQNNCFSLLI